ncbi:MAG TPA: methylenetetrahydrofolate--tRNA-(uracil(54)-C(5))-methyltransferase (FADH(2)-oxidizing) TrmFO [Candidatus Dormibacteraeota bacterium]|nr:methylenetetrahydrofolate--tRNA-(uracil(54)-C(5))-methyltransferase (FADH(2)-oxidizing) TrmFO [Candidatus Dormibacteraeota bacterium]
MIDFRLLVVGGGLAGCEAAWQAASQGVPVTLAEMRPLRTTPAHHTELLAELVCSNSLRGAALENAVGLLKEELARLDSVIVSSAREAAVPAGGALAVDRERFSRLVTERVERHPLIEVRREEIAVIDPSRPTIIACGPLASEALAGEIDRLVGGRLHYYDAASPIVAADSIEMTELYAASRYGKGDGDDYLNIPLDKERYLRLVEDLRTLPRHEPKEFERDAACGTAPFFEGCLPVEVMAERGVDTLRYGPLKPVGLRDPRTGKTPYAVVQLRRENAAGTAYNLVGFQTRLTWPAQKEAFGRLPALGRAEWLRLGVMHRNTFIQSPRLLDRQLRLREHPNIWFAGQVTGVEGYVEAAGSGAIAGLQAARALRGEAPLELAPTTMLGCIVAYLQDETSRDFQPSNVTWANIAPLPPELETRDKRERRRRLAERALRDLEILRATLGRTAGYEAAV